MIGLMSLKELMLMWCCHGCDVSYGCHHLMQEPTSFNVGIYVTGNAYWIRFWYKSK